MKRLFAAFSAFAALSLASVDAASFPQGYSSSSFNPSFTNQIALADDANKLPKDKDKDKELSDKIKKALHNNLVTKNFPKVEFDVQQGHVTLKGSVQNEQDKNSAAEKVKAIDGVIDVKNDIVVDKNLKAANLNKNKKAGFKDNFNATPYLSYNTTADKRIADSIYKQISAHSNAKQLTIDVNYGTVTVSGLVPNKQSKTQLIGKIRHVNGVLAVQDNLLLKKTEPQLIPQPAKNDANNKTINDNKDNKLNKNANETDDDDEEDDDDDDDDDDDEEEDSKNNTNNKNSPNIQSNPAKKPTPVK